jgi:hypothetical protein
VSSCISSISQLFLSGLGSNSFDIIIDKGTLDAQLGGPKGMPEVVGTVAEVVRLLRIDGVYHRGPGGAAVRH